MDGRRASVPLVVGRGTVETCVRVSVAAPGRLALRLSVGNGVGVNVERAGVGVLLPNAKALNTLADIAPRERERHWQRSS